MAERYVLPKHNDLSPTHDDELLYIQYMYANWFRLLGNIQHRGTSSSLPYANYSSSKSSKGQCAAVPARSSADMATTNISADQPHVRKAGHANMEERKRDRSTGSKKREAVGHTVE